MYQTKVSIEADKFKINGDYTYAERYWQGTKIEGLLLNSRMVQGIFDDLNPETRQLWRYPDTGEWDPDRNTDEFIKAMPTWREKGLLSFVLCLQGGNPQGYRQDQPWINPGFTAEGNLRADYQKRLERILDKADELRMVVQLSLFYFGQDQHLQDEEAIHTAVKTTINWILQKGYQNIIIEINNECDVDKYTHDILKPTRVNELIKEAKNITHQGRRLLVSTSFKGGSIPTADVMQEADFILIHGNGQNPADITKMVEKTREMKDFRSMPIVFNEDDHYDFAEENNNMLNAIRAYASWGYLDCGKNNYQDGYQSPPVQWGINTPRKQAFFSKVEELTGGLNNKLVE